MLEQKKEIEKKLVDKYNQDQQQIQQLQQNLNTLGQQILKLQGGIEVLEEQEKLKKEK